MDPPQDAAQRGGEGAGEGGRLIGGGFGTERLRNPPARAERERLGSGRQPWSPASWRGGRSQPRIQVFGGGLLGRGCGIRQGWGLEERGHGVLVPPRSHGYVLREDPARHRGWSQHPCCSAWWGAQKGWGHPQGMCQLPPGAPHPFGSGTQRWGAGTERITPNPCPTSIPFGDPTPAPQKQVPPPLFLVHRLTAGCWLPAVAVLAARGDGQTLKGTFRETVGAKGFWDV